MGPPPLEQPTGRVRGSVTLISNLFNESGTKVGERALTDADSVRVYLLAGATGAAVGAKIDSTWTLDGAFEFTAPPTGSYQLGVQVASAVWVTSDPFAWASESSAVPPLTVRPVGSLENPPNPFEDSHGVGLQGVFPQTVFASFEGLSLSGRREFFYEQQSSGFFHVHWGGIPVAISPGPHWAVVRFQNECWYNVVLSEESG
ncbi:MAG: hypothetical protein U0527_15420 [Candidatus Eisenbacteria bacterium]